MTIKELKNILKKYNDKQLIAITIKDSEDTFLVTDIAEVEDSILNGLELLAELPEPFKVLED